MNKQNQNGSALVIALIFIGAIVVAALGFVWWQSYNRNAPQVKTSQEEPEDSNPENSIKENAEDQSGYLVLEQWGVKFKIPSVLSTTEISYSIASDTVALTTARIEALGGECIKAPYNVTVSLTRHTEKPQPGPATLLNEVSIDGYYYTTYGPPASCSSFKEDGEMQAANKIELDDRVALKEMLTSLTKV